MTPVDDRGIQTTWLDARDEQRAAPAETVGALRDVVGEQPADLDQRAPLVVRPGDDLRAGPGDVWCEDGSRRHVVDRLPADFPLGYHRWRTHEGHDRALIVSPGRCWLPAGGRAWGWAAQVYATRSHASWGIGDLADLRVLRRWAQGLGAGFLLVNPLHAVAPTLPQEASPYLPSSRRFLNPLYLRVEEVPGADAVELRDLAEQGRALNASRRIDRDAVWALKREALRRVFEVRRPDPDFDRWRVARGEPLQRFALWNVLAERHGPDWRDWPPRLRDAQPGIRNELADRHSGEVELHAWVQWQLDRQLREACRDMIVVQDLPVGVDGGGADAWEWRDQFAAGVAVGAPPDAFNAAGQSWGSPPLVPWRLRAAEYDAFVQSIRATLSLTGGLRIDQVLGLFRLWWVPEGRSPREGAYVRYPADDLLDIVALESHRAGALVIGEDLGTVEDGVREAMAERGMLSYRLLWFEDDDPAAWRELSLATVTTHDLPTVAGLWTGTDLAEQHDHGMSDPTARQRLLRRLGDLDPDAGPDQAVLAAYRRLARAPAMLLAATLEDAVLEERRPNMPGVPSRPNWSQALPVPLEELHEHPTALALAGILRDAVRGERSGG